MQTKPIYLSSLESRKAVIRQIIKTQGLDERGRIPWRLAFERNPAWGVQLGYGDTTKFSAVMSAASRILRTDPEFAEYQKKKDHVATPAVKPERNGSSERATEPEAAPIIRYCPGCGLDLALFAKAFHVARRHSR